MRRRGDSNRAVVEKEIGRVRSLAVVVYRPIRRVVSVEILRINSRTVGCSSKSYATASENMLDLKLITHSRKKHPVAACKLHTTCMMQNDRPVCQVIRCIFCEILKKLCACRLKNAENEGNFARKQPAPPSIQNHDFSAEAAENRMAKRLHHQPLLTRRGCRPIWALALYVTRRSTIF